jgi:tetratricopeptide (TPR) repeat protein
MIARSALVLASSMLAIGAAHAHSVTVIGSNADAIACYRAAESESKRPDALVRCSAAIEERQLTDRDRMATFVNRGIVRFRLEDLSGALADFDSALALTPGQPDALVNRGIVMLAAGAEVGEAIAVIEQGMARGPQRPWVGYYGRGVAHELAGRDEDAYRDYRRARDMRPGWRPAEQALARFAVVG